MIFSIVQTTFHKLALNVQFSVRVLFRFSDKMTHHSIISSAPLLFLFSSVPSSLPLLAVLPGLVMNTSMMSSSSMPNCSGVMYGRISCPSNLIRQKIEEITVVYQIHFTSGTFRGLRLNVKEYKSGSGIEKKL